MKSVREITDETSKRIMDRGYQYARNVVFNENDDSPEEYIKDLRGIIKDYDLVRNKTEREEKLPSSEEFLEMIKKTIGDFNISDITEFRLGLQTQNCFPPDGITGHSFFNTKIPHKYHPDEHTEMIDVDEFYSALLDYFGSEFIWEDSITQGDLINILGERVVDFFKVTRIPFYFEGTLIDWNEEFPDEIDLFFGENEDS
jgi:hypothetical protein